MPPRAPREFRVPSPMPPKPSLTTADTEPTLRDHETITIVVGPPSNPTLFSVPTEVLATASPILASMINTNNRRHHNHVHRRHFTSTPYRPKSLALSMAYIETPYKPKKPVPLCLPHVSVYVFKRVVEWLVEKTLTPRDLSPPARETGNWKKTGCSVGGGDGYPVDGPRPYDEEGEWRRLLAGVYVFGNEYRIIGLCCAVSRERYKAMRKANADKEMWASFLRGDFLVKDARGRLKKKDVGGRKKGKEDGDEDWVQVVGEEVWDLDYEHEIADRMGRAANIGKDGYVAGMVRWVVSSLKPKKRGPIWPELAGSRYERPTGE
ncbi:hypothetical protein K490DRAFT_67833 [Saccharata proteae CBS 121410]|uniref:BTB domain-containing protein n=1 Tax=Saccharata proteae CBS 121410 TaxID=1314787 RepID=A0A9P4HT14_9PEZI|nr:hypothetical protein K490DRAFT_67833 [Saccharata proteae CBS 121410]